MATYAVTGSNGLGAAHSSLGFIASHLVKMLLEQGHSVQAIVRHDPQSAKCQHLDQLSKEFPGKVSIKTVAQLDAVDALANAFKGCNGVFHMAATHPTYGFKDTENGRNTLVGSAVDGTVSVLKACVSANVKRVVLTSSLAAVECGNDEGELKESTWSKSEVYDSVFNMKSTQWGTHYMYVKSKTEQEKAAMAFCAENGLDLRVIVPGNLCVGPIANKEINGTMARLRDIMNGTNTLMGAADLGVVHVLDVVKAHLQSMVNDQASGRYLVSPDMVQTSEIPRVLKMLYPSRKVATQDNMDFASGIPGQARKIDASRTVRDLGIQFKALQETLQDAIESLIANGHLSAQPKFRLLHLAGSPTSAYYEKLSLMYAQGCATSTQDALNDEFESCFAMLHPDGPSWSFPDNLSEESVAAAPRVAMSVGISKISTMHIDVCQNHMFCTQGVSTYRALLDMLNIPFVGGSVDAMTLTTHKGRTRDVVHAAGVACPEAEVVRAGERPKLSVPFILKPMSEDNSMGVTLVKEETQLAEALEKAFAYDSEVLCERFIPPGRELRVAVIEDEKGFPTTPLPAVEYLMTADKPIRTSQDKTMTDEAGMPLEFAKPDRQCPAIVDDVLKAKLEDAAKLAHTALGCRDYSVYDFRVDPEGHVYFLEASLFCCFAPNSVISMMGNASGIPEMAHATLFKTLLKRAMARKITSKDPKMSGSKPKAAALVSS